MQSGRSSTLADTSKSLAMPSFVKETHLGIGMLLYPKTQPLAEKCVSFFMQLWTRQRAWLLPALEQSTANWKMVVGHAPPENFEESSCVGQRFTVWLNPGKPRGTWAPWAPCPLCRCCVFVCGGPNFEPHSSGRKCQNYQDLSADRFEHAPTVYMETTIRHIHSSQES